MPYTSITMGGVALPCFPHWDPVFAGEVRRRFGELQASTPEALEERLRRTFPLAVVHARDDLASFVGTAWYVYRDGRYSLFSQPTACGRTSTPRLILADDGAYLDATDPALSLLGVSHDELLAAHSGDFTTPEFRETCRGCCSCSGTPASCTACRCCDCTAAHRTSPSSTTSPVMGRPGRHVSAFRLVPLEAFAAADDTGVQAGVSGAGSGPAPAPGAHNPTTTVERVEAGEGPLRDRPAHLAPHPVSDGPRPAPTQPAGMPSDEAGHHKPHQQPDDEERERHRQWSDDRHLDGSRRRPGDQPDDQPGDREQ